MRYPFLIDADHGLVSTNVWIGWKKTRQLTAQAIMKVNEFEKAEEAEFVRKAFREAIDFYRSAFTSASSANDRAIILSRIGRCYFKMQRYREGIEEYQKISGGSEPNNVIGGVPAYVVARMQIADGFEALGSQRDRNRVLTDLYAELLNFPWDLEGGQYTYYLKSVSASLSADRGSHNGDPSLQQNFMTLRAREQQLDKQIRFLNLVHAEIMPVIEAEMKRGSLPELQPRHVAMQDGETTRQLGFVKLPPSFRQMGLVALGYEIEAEFVLAELLPKVLSSVNFGPDVTVGILNDRDSILYLQDQLPLSTYLVAESFTESFSTWKVALFDRGGKSLEQQMTQEKRLYVLLFVGIIAVMAVGIIVTARAAIHEMEVARMKSDFVANVSHELKTPLSLIRMFGETLEAGIVADEAKRREFYTIIRKESERLSHLINNVLDFSRMDSGNKEYRFEEADLVEVVRSTLEAYKFHIRDLGFEVESVFPDEPVIANIDKDAIAQALLNLLSNATRYSEEQKVVRVAVEPNSDSVHISVADQGVGIPKQEHHRIFDKFYRASTTKTRETRGAGLGLTFVKHIAEAHKGTVEVESVVGKGSTFTISIPLDPFDGS